MMKRIILSLAVTLCTTMAANAQLGLRILNHLSVGANAGTMGIGADVAMPLTRFVDIEAGFTIMPKIAFSTNVGLNSSELPDIGQYKGPDSFGIKGETKLVNGKLIFNVMPIPVFRTFHIGVGAYFGNGNILNVYNREDGALKDIVYTNNLIREYNSTHPDNPQKLYGLEVGNYLLEPDENGNVNASVAVKKFKPYVGIGFGKAVPNRRLGFKCDLGCVFWGSPSLTCNGVDLTKEDFNGGGSAIKAITKIKVYPVLNLRLCGRIF